jgi:hypothetical protein
MTTHAHPTAAIQGVEALAIRFSSLQSRKRTFVKAPGVRQLTMAAGFGVAALICSLGAHAEGKDKTDLPQYAGALAFAPDGTLFVGDNISSAVFAYKTGLAQPETIDPKAAPLEVESIDNRIAPVVHGKLGQVEINGMAVHPTSREIYLSVSRGSGGIVTPAIVKVSLSGKISEFELNSPGRSEFTIKDAPTLDQHFADRAGQWPVPSPAKYHQKAKTPMRSMTIVDMKFHNGELYIAGISNQEFASTLRRVRYPFTDEISETKIKIYHDAHAQWETRAPIRAMTFAQVDGKDTLVAAYVCSPLVLIPVEDLKDGAKIEGHVIGDMGNGQPLSMFSFKFNGEDSIFVTNAAHDPRIIPVASLQHAKVMTEADSPHHMVLDTTGLPAGVVGKAAMFVGSSLHADLLNEKFLVSLTRNANSGTLTLEALPTYPLPTRLDAIWSEFDFPPLKN